MIKMKFQGRGGNILLQNVGLSILSKKFDLKVVNYNSIDAFRPLGLNLNNGNLMLDNIVEYQDPDLNNLLQMDSINNGISYDGTFQVKDFVLNYRNDIVSHFDLKYEEVDKNQVFIHVRLDDAAHNNPGINYYKKSLESINFSGGFISTDTPNHWMISELINTYGLKLYQNNPMDTINFAKNFNNIILSKGTFSWWIGLLSKADNIIYPIGDTPWYGDIFVYDDWKTISV